MEISPIIQSLCIVNSNTASNTERLQATNFLEGNVKQQNVEILIPIATSLLSGQQESFVRYFALQILEVICRERWNNINKDDKQRFIQLLLSLLSSNTLFVERFLKEKYSFVVVEVAKREVPQNWNDFFSSFLSLCSRGEYYIEIVLIILRVFAEEIKQFNSDLSDKRRKDLSNTLLKECSSIFPFFQQLLYYYINQITINTNGQNDTVNMVLIVENTLNTLESYLSWSPIEYVFYFVFFCYFFNYL